MSDVYATLLRDLGERDPRIVVLDAGLAEATRTHLFRQRFPERYFNLGIAEQNVVSLASGIARQGFVPLVHSFSNFLTRRAQDQIAVSVAWPNCAVKLVGCSCGLFDGRGGFSHTATNDLAAMATLPNMTVTEPDDVAQLTALLPAIIAAPGPAYLRLRRYGMPSDLLAGSGVGLGTRLSPATGDAVGTVVAGGSMLETALSAAAILAGRGMPVDVAGIAMLKPLDSVPILESARRTGRVAVLENHCAAGGFGDAVSRLLGPLGIPHIRLSLPDEVLPSGSPEWLQKRVALDAPSVATQIATFLKERDTPC